MEEKKDQKIEIRSEEVQDILGQIPSWIVRWGTVVILASVLIILVGSMIFRYPDKKQAEILVTTENPPAPMVARSEGRLRLFVKDSQEVKIYDRLAVIENPADYLDVVSLRFDIKQIRTIVTELDKEDYIPLDNTYNLGDIQTAYAEFINRYEDYFDFLKRDYHEKLISSVEKEIESHRMLNRDLSEKVRVLKRDYELAEIQFGRDETVFLKGAIAEADRDRSEQNKLSAQSKYIEARQERSNNDIEISKLNQKVQQHRLQAQQEREQMQSGVREAFDILISQVDIWEQNYLLQAPTDGRVSRGRFYSETQVVRTGDNVMTIIPANQGDTIGKINLPLEGSGKVDIGQTVNIQLTNFPHLQYGMVMGIIRTISQVPDGQQYVLEVEFPNGLTTYYGNHISFQQEMLGRAEIITDDRVLIERIFSPIRSAITEQRETRRDSETNSQSE
jgi:HlyD family secretion protein